MSWVSPTGHEDPEESWHFPERAYDDNTSSFVEGGRPGGKSVPPGEWSDFLILTINSIYSEAVRFWCAFHPGRWDAIDVDVYKDESWVDVYEGAYTTEWIEKTFASGYVTKARLRIHVDSGYDYKSACYTYEFDFGEAEAPVVQPYSYIM